jgi:glycosyltransferase involved in cell wall biosynthesis
VAVNPARILVLIKGLGVGGAEKLLSEGARYWDRERFEYHVGYALPWKDQLVDEIRALGFEVHLLGSKKGLTPRVAGNIRRVVRDRGIDLVHAHSPTMGVIARIVSPVPVVYTEHNVAESYRPPTRFFNRATYSRQRAVIAVSDAVAASVSTWRGPNVRVIPNGVSVSVDPAQTSAARSELGIADDSSLIVHVGNIRPGKGHEVLIAAAAILRERDRRLRWASIGGEKYEGDLARVRDRAAASGVGDDVQFLGRRADALGFVGAADVYVNPSEVEGLPVSILEAMALERPIVATAAGGVPSVIRDGETGVLVEPGDPQALADGVQRLLDDPALAKRLGAAARVLVEQEHGLEHMVRAVEAVYEEILG